MITDDTLKLKLSNMYGIEKSRTTPYHPDGNGRCKRFNRTLNDMLRKMPSDKKSKWSQFLPEVVYEYNASPHSSTGYSPYYLFFGCEPKLPVDHPLGLDNDDDEEGIGEMTNDWVATHYRRLEEVFLQTNRGGTEVNHSQRGERS